MTARRGRGKQDSPPPCVPPRGRPHLQLLQGEAASELNLQVVAGGLAADQGAQRAGGRAGEGRLRLRDAGYGGGGGAREGTRARGALGRIPLVVSGGRGAPKQRPTLPPVLSPLPHTRRGRGEETSPATPPSHHAPFRRRSFRAGWLNHVFTRTFQSCGKGEGCVSIVGRHDKQWVRRGGRETSPHLLKVLVGQHVVFGHHFEALSPGAPNAR